MGSSDHQISGSMLGITPKMGSHTIPYDMVLPVLLLHHYYHTTLVLVLVLRSMYTTEYAYVLS